MLISVVVLCLFIYTSSNRFYKCIQKTKEKTHKGISFFLVVRRAACAGNRCLKTTVQNSTIIVQRCVEFVVKRQSKVTGRVASTATQKSNATAWSGTSVSC